MLKLVLTLISITILLCGCGAETDNAASSSTPGSGSQRPENWNATRDASNSNLVLRSARSWSQIVRSGSIRALKFQWEEENSLPRSGSTSLYHIELMQQFAALHQLKLEWVKVQSLGQMFDALAGFKADVIPRHLTITAQRSDMLSFTNPLVTDTEMLVAKKGTPAYSEGIELNVTVPENTSYIESIRQQFPSWKLTTLKQSLNSEAIADALADGEFQFSVLDGQSVATLTSYRNDIVSLLSFPETKKMAWATSKNNQSLLDKLNEFIAVHHISQSSIQHRLDDLDVIKKQNLALRVITRNSPETYFLWKGELAGFEYELMREFAKRHEIRFEMIVAESYQHMLALLEQGSGDIIAAGISRTVDRESELEFSNRYNLVSELLVAHKDASPINSLEDLKGRVISVRKTSAFWSTAQKLKQQYAVEVALVDETMPTELIIAQVAEQKLDLTIADSNLIGIEKRFRDNITTPLILKTDIPYAYALRKNNPQLVEALNVFIKSIYRGTFYNVVKSKYFSSKKRQEAYRENRIVADSDLSPYDTLVRDRAREYQFDWRLITSQMFQESRFNPNAKSNAGALGLMQVLPKTGEELGYLDLSNPEQSISAGIKYLDWTRQRFINDIPLEERVYFALAAYNAGFGHVRDAQRLARDMDLRGDRWFDNVEQAMLLLQDPKYYKSTRYGYCRGSEPVNYVRNIQQRYLTYIEVKK